ncbi:MAG: ferritin [Planctomycetes bacterium]|nr:ferritin [Planctomycetota bacterium]
MLKPEIESALNDQFNMEQSASHGYLAMTAYLDARNPNGFAAFMRRQADEERVHALKIFDHISERGGTPKLMAIEAPEQDFDSVKAVFEAARDREGDNTRSIHALFKLARDHDDYPTQTMLQWFIEEQVEEEAWCDEAVDLLTMAGDSSSALLMLDQKYGGLATAPTDE